MSILRACGWLLVPVATAGTLRGQEPATVNENPLAGAIDFHVHSGPDAFTRSIDDVQIARLAGERKMAAIVLKNHFTSTADRAALAERLAGGVRCYGGIVLNRAVGGLNEEAVRRMVDTSGNRGKVVWLPTFDAENHVRHFKEDRPSVAVVRDGRLVPELKPVFALIVQHKLVLQTGHSSAEECLLLIAAARKAGITRMVVTHAMADPIGMNMDQLKQAARLGAKLECVWASNLMGPDSHLASNRHWRKVTTADYVKAIKAVGAEHFILSSDLGQYLNPVHTDGMKAFILGLREAGIAEQDIDLMCRKNPARLLDLEQK